MILGIARRLLGLPAPRCRSATETCFVPMRDGVRLATLHVWPVDVADEPGTIVIRTPYGAGARSVMGLAARLLAESGHHVILQDVRGRYGSEGRFVPFASEQRDGGDTLHWVAAQPWSNGRIGLFGFSYLAYTAWCSLIEAPEHVAALVSAIGGRDVYSIFHRGGALCLANAFEWGLGVGDRGAVPARHIDLARGLAHRPVREGDRVASRTVDWLREWIDHPARDAYWNAMIPALPESVPPVVSIAGWYDFFLDAQLDDHATINARARERGGPRPRLVVGPWAHGLPAQRRWWRRSLFGHALREAIHHFDAHLARGRGAPERAGVRYFLAGPDTWNDAESWPPPESSRRRLYLIPGDARGMLSTASSNDPLPTRRYRSDPENPLPALGGALFGRKGGVEDQRRLDERDDLLVYDSPPLDHAVTLAGRVRLRVHLETDVEDVDVTARLIDHAPDGPAVNVCDGILRARWRDGVDEPGTPRFLERGRVHELVVDLGHASRVFAVGHRIRVVIGGACFPRFDRNPGSRTEPARAPAAEFRTTESIVHHGVDRPSCLEVDTPDDWFQAE